MSDFPPPDGAPRDRRREPIFSIPAVVVALLAVLIGAYAAFSVVSPATQDAAMRAFAFLPGRLTLAIWPDRLAELLARVSSDQEALAQATLVRHYRAASGGAGCGRFSPTLFCMDLGRTSSSIRSGSSPSARRSLAASARSAFSLSSR